MQVLFDGPVSVHYGYVFLLATARHKLPDLMDARRGQVNGLCGAAVPGVLSMITGLHTGEVPLVIEWHDVQPPPQGGWEDIVEASLDAQTDQAVLSAFDQSSRLTLPAIGPSRARFHANGMDAAHDQDTRCEGDPTVDRYLLQLWPADIAADSIVRSASAYAHYWHEQAAALDPPSSPEPEPEPERKVLDLRARMWGDPPPSPRLSGLRGNVLGVARTDRALLDAFEQLAPATQRAAARWLLRRAFEIAALDTEQWAAAGLDALDRDQPLPPPFGSPAEAFARLNLGRAAVLVATATVGRARRSPPHAPRKIHRPSFALPAIFAAREDDPLQALVDAFSHAAAAFDDRRNELIADLTTTWLTDPNQAANPLD